LIPYNKQLKKRSRELRSRMTDAELALWAKLRRKQLCGLQFYRQRPISNYIVDFFCPAAKLVIEIDGGQHYKEEGGASDAERDLCLQNLGLCVLRFSNLDVLGNLEGVITVLEQHLKDSPGPGKRKSP